MVITVTAKEARGDAIINCQEKLWAHWASSILIGLKQMTSIFHQTVHSSFRCKTGPVSDRGPNKRRDTCTTNQFVNPFLELTGGTKQEKDKATKPPRALLPTYQSRSPYQLETSISQQSVVHAPRGASYQEINLIVILILLAI